MEEIARVYADALFEVAKDNDELDEIHDQLGQFADAMNSSNDMRVFFFSPVLLLGRQARGDPAARSPGASDELVNFLELLAEKHRMPAIFRIRDRFDELWAEAKKRLEVTLTSAVELDDKIVEQVREEVERQTDREIDLEAQVDPDILGGLVLRVGNMVLDASLRSKLEKIEKGSRVSDCETANARHASQGVRMTAWRSSPTRFRRSSGSGSRGSRPTAADLAEVGTVLSVADGIARVHGLDNCMSLELLDLPHDVTGLALNLEADNVGVVLFGEWDKIVEGDTVKRTGRLLEIPVGNRAARPDRRPARAARSTTRATSTPPRPGRPSSRPRAWSSASR